MNHSIVSRARCRALHYYLGVPGYVYQQTYMNVYIVGQPTGQYQEQSMRNRSPTIS